jgi:hypothetical protein
MERRRKEGRKEGGKEGCPGNLIDSSRDIQPLQLLEQIFLHHLPEGREEVEGMSEGVSSREGGRRGGGGVMKEGKNEGRKERRKERRR